ncbi:MAG: tellurite resistance TerB family protein [Bacteroidales bacterium]|nr:tellurite resistance TerB family protein [Bacteroidales bacterium]
MFNAKQLLNQLVQTKQSANLGGLLSNPAVTGALGGVGGGLLTGMLLNSRNSGKIAGGIGAAALGGVALNVYKNWQANKNVPQKQQQPQPSKNNALDFDSMPAAKQDEHSKAMLAAIIATAKADGQFDERERKLIREETDKLNDPQASAWVQQEVNKPLDVKYVAGLATSEEMASEIYYASLMAADRQNQLDVRYLESLAKELKLDPQLKLEIEQQLM